MFAHLLQTEADRDPHHHCQDCYTKVALRQTQVETDVDAAETAR